MQDLQWKMNNMPKTEDKNLPLMSMEEVFRDPSLQASPHGKVSGTGKCFCKG